jgi:hypothetical protein
VLHFTLSEFDEMTIDEIRKWHREAVAIVKAMRGGR